ncbi:MAG: sodium:alanine symporter family protein [Candidatus Nitronauta litoralis]|uniref:Sodium:alanine symporter family protein n=1 Tax=Candidatus Nitronauta litoralis TaxID=2705533 RepID=A0A7T0G0I9_9BACT|nr:MAG: sodium:alanine symporter family protein [Candidatus Nitronauta litoralis]
MESLTQSIAAVRDMLWGPWLLVLLVGTGVWLTVLLRGIQFRLLFRALRFAFSGENSGQGDVSHFAALMISLAATVGVGNIAGVATAVASGGPGAVVWMWITALFGMATKYAEAFLAVRFREVNQDGEISGGPMYYLKNGMNAPRLAWAFAFFGAIAAFGIGNMVQANTTAAALKGFTGLPPVAIGIALSILTWLVIIGGVKRIASVVAYVVPFMVLVYFLGSLIILIRHWAEIPAGLVLLFKSAFSGQAAIGGFAGATVAQAISFGVARGLFSNESGLGSAPIAAAAAKTDQPGKQALVSMTGTFIDTLIVCSLTGLVLAVTGVWETGKSGVELTQLAFASGLGSSGETLITFAVATFAFSTILGWGYYGEKCFEYLTRQRWVLGYRYAWVVFVFLGAVLKIELVWNLSDAMNALMALPNLIGLIALSMLVAKESKIFEKEIDSGS